MANPARIAAAWLVCALLTLGAAQVRAAAERTPAPVAARTADATPSDEEVVDEPATLRILNRDVVTLRARVLGLTPAQRVERAGQRLREMPASAGMEPISVVAASTEGVKGTQFMLGDRLIFGIVAGDADADAGQSYAQLVKQTRSRVEEMQKVWVESRDRTLLWRGVARSLAATAVLGLLVWAAQRASRVAMAWMERKRDAIAAIHPYVDWREFLARMAVGTMQLLQWFVLLALVYSWAVFVLGSFVLTEPIAGSLGDWLWGKAAWVAEGVFDSLPGVVTVAIVLVVTRAVADVLRYFFEMLREGRLQLPAFHPETIPATRRIFTLIVWALGLAVAYPHLPGSSSDAFKGVSVLLGLMITLGSSGIVTQAMSGLVIVYSRAIRKDDFVDINGVQGVVSEIAWLAIKVVTVRNEEITIPNSVVVSTPIHNFSKLGPTHGTLLTAKVTIGYDAPWRRVHALLTGAARATPRVRATPEPYVLQRALSDFYVEYELFCSIEDAQLRIPIASDLYAAIQDAFNEAGVQIMSPHYLGQPDAAVVVPKSKWWAPPARPS